MTNLDEQSVGSKVRSMALMMESWLAGPRSTWSFCDKMTRIALLLPAIAFAVGCDAVSITEIAIRPGSRDPERSSAFADEMIRVCRDNSARFGLSEIEGERQDARVAFTDSVAGQNPDLWLTLEHGTVPATVEIAEMYISSRTDKHNQLVASLMDGFAKGGLTADIIYQTRDERGWKWLLVVAMLISGAVVWWSVRRRLRARRSATEHK